ncbi:hypothetical protein AZA_40510 [Nitrospirillum viridazoti Y2]|nr:hypothetical protein AZA_40510 [Nitrospirillum amazonense Y2]
MQDLAGLRIHDNGGVLGESAHRRQGPAGQEGQGGPAQAPGGKTRASCQVRAIPMGHGELPLPPMPCRWWR